MINLKVGDRVVIGAGIKKREGVVIEVVPPKKHSKAIGAFHKGRQLAKRDHESYIVESPRPGRKTPDKLWPRVGTLTSISAAPAPAVTVKKEKLPDGRVVTTTTKVEVEASDMDTDFVLCLDASGSMQVIDNAARHMFNNQVEAIQNAAKAGGMRSPRVSLYTFGGMGVTEVFFRRPVEEIKPLSASEYRTTGNTPMFDSVGVAIERLLRERDIANPNLSIVLNVITDGEENSSRQHNEHSINKLFTETRATDRWTHAFLVPRGARKGFLNRFMSIPEGNVVEWDVSTRGMQEVAALNAASTSNFMNQRVQSKGVLRSSKNYYVQPDLSKMSVTDLAKMTDLSGLVKVHKVDKELAIKEFIEGVTKSPYVIGSAYYQLMKVEKAVQPQKNILLRHRKTGKIYGGMEARTLIGLPFNQTVKVEPGNHADFDIFIESTSINRILPRGTMVLHDFNQKVNKQPTWDHTVLTS